MRQLEQLRQHFARRRAATYELLFAESVAFLLIVAPMQRGTVAGITWLA
jgi:hypothetical protein